MAGILFSYCVMAALRVAKKRESVSRQRRGKHKRVENESDSDSSGNEDDTGQTAFRKGALVRVQLHNFL